MIDEIATPWFDSALQRLGLRKGERALALEPHRRDVVALRAAIGDARPQCASFATATTPTQHTTTVDGGRGLAATAEADRSSE